MTLLVHHLVTVNGRANVALEIVERDLLLFQNLVELPGVGRFDLVELAIDFSLGGQQASFSARRITISSSIICRRIFSVKLCLFATGACWALRPNCHSTCRHRTEDFAASTSHHIAAYL